MDHDPSTIREASRDIPEGAGLSTNAGDTEVTTTNPDGSWEVDEYEFIGYANRSLRKGQDVGPSDIRQFPVTVGLLKQQLAALDDDLPVIMQKDAEGSGYSPCEGVDLAVYEEENSHSGQCHRPERDVVEYLKENEIETIPCAVLWPSN